MSVLTTLADLAYARGDYEAARQILEEALKVDPAYRELYLKLAQAENELGMQETALQHVDDYLHLSSKKNEEFGDKIRDAMKLRADIEKRLKERGGKQD
jgi:tetratricopeptide (TPR) repeat protein